YGSVYRPQEAGGGGEHGSLGRAGGGVVRITADALVVDGAIRANGTDAQSWRDSRGGAGGSVWIRTRAFEGSGSIEARGGHGDETSGGGGAVAVEYTELSTRLPGYVVHSGTDGLRAGAGTVWVHGPASIYGDLRIDNAGQNGQPTELPSLGSGVTQAGTGGEKLVTDRAAIPAYFVGHWVEVRAPDETLRGRWRIASIEGGAITLAPNGAEVIGVSVGDSWTGIYRFDSVDAVGGPQKLVSNDPIVVGAESAIELSGPTGAGQYLELTTPIAAESVTVTGNVAVAGVEAHDLTIRDGTLAHAAGAAETFRIALSGTLTIGPTGAIDVSGRGFRPGQTYPGATPPGSMSAGSHMGIGGVRGPPAASTYGSVYRPQEAGGGGEHGSLGRAGGGVVRITAEAVVVDGAIRANGTDAQSWRNSRGGAGGSVWITTSAFEGSGSIEARGGHGDETSGGGGAIAIEYTRAATRLPSYANHSGTDGVRGGAGTVWIHGPGSVYGDLIVDNAGQAGQPTRLPSLGFGYAAIGSSGATLLTDLATIIPQFFTGHFVEIRDTDRVLKGTGRIAAIDGRTITLERIGGETFDIRPGDSWRGAYHFDSVTLSHANLESPDPLRLTSPAVLGPASKLVAANEAPPLLDPALVAIVSATVGPSVIGQAEAVLDPDAPSTVTVRNDRTGAESRGVVSSDGSFVVAISGVAGDSISLRATDGHVFALESPWILLGTLPASTPDSIRLDRSVWGVDGGFRARTVARDGSIIAVAAYPVDGTGSSSRVVILDVSNPAAPVVRSTLAGTGAVRDLAVHGGWAFVAADRFWAIDLTGAVAAPVYTTDTCGREYALAVSGGYAFAAEADCSSSNVIYVYDVSTPAAPRYLYSKSVGSYTPFAFTDLLALGTDWLIALSPNRPNNVGHDLIVIDRRDPNDLRKVAELEIENFDAFRGVFDGDVLWVISRASSEAATIDLSDPKAPTLIARAFAGAEPNGITVGGGYAVIAAGGSGLVAFDASDPTLLTRAGTLAMTNPAWDVTAFAGSLWVADDQGIAIVPVDIAPVVDSTRILVEVTPTSALVRGLPLAITGGSMPTVEVNGPAGVSAMTSVAGDGSFAVTIDAEPGQHLVLTIRDGDGRSQSLTLTVPFAASVDVMNATPAEAGGDSSYRARALASGDGRIVATTGSHFGSSVPVSDKALLFTLPNASAAASVASIQTTAGGLYESALFDEWALAVGNRLVSWSLGTTSPTLMSGDVDPVGIERAVAVVPGYAFTAEGDGANDGRVFTWDLSSPSSPRQIGAAGLAGASGVNFVALVPAEPSLLIAISPSRPGGMDRDVTIIDRSNPAALVRLGLLGIPDFDAVDAAVFGATIYVVGLDAGLAIVDISDPAAPRLLVTLDTPGIARAVAVSGPDEIVVADGGGPGLTFIDVADRTRPIIIGTQPLVGNATDVRVIGKDIHVATDHHVQIVRRP
ncbi:MAG: hypothetical protein ACRD2J_05105, partial [Thermoanaerobaculia bacterium]